MPVKQGDLELLKNPIAQQLLVSQIPARLAYIWTDGTPRVIPIWFHWNGSEFVMGTPPKAPKLKALVKNPKVAVATYDLETVGVLQSAPYVAIAGANSSPWTKRTARFRTGLMRYEGEQLFPGGMGAPKDAAALLLIAMNVAPEHEAEFNEWYNTEHIPALGGVKGTLSARRYRGTDATQRYVALYHLALSEVPYSTEWKAAANTPWTERMRPHFRDHLRFECRRYSRTGYICCQQGLLS
jgi:hypothetical protein